MRNLQPNLEFDSIIGHDMFRMLENREFCRKKDNGNSNQKAVVTGLSNCVKAVPVVVLLAMSPMYATSRTAQMLEQFNDNNTVEMYSQLP